MLDAIISHAKQSTAFRRRTNLQPVGGSGDVVYPPTYADGSTRHDRVIDGERVPCVLLDSVASQANRMEESLIDTGVPRLQLEIAGAVVSTLTAPHRFTDVILRSCDGYPERALLDRDVPEIFGYAPNSLLFGCWHSNRKGGPGLRVPRAITSEIVAVDVADSPHVASRVDPLPFSKASKITVNDTVAGWALAKSGKNKPSDALLGNIPPDIENGRGITMRHAEQTCVISLVALRNLELSDTQRGILAAIGLAAFTRAFESGCWLRSRCHLIPTAPASWEVVVGPSAQSLGEIKADELLSEVEERVGAESLPWHGETTLTPSKDLVKLVDEGRAALGKGGERE